MCEEGVVLAAAVSSCAELLELSPVPPSVVICDHLLTALTLTEFQLPNLMSHSFSFTVTDAAE